MPAFCEMEPSIQQNSDVIFEGMKVSGSEATGLAEESCIMKEPIISSTQGCSRGQHTVEINTKTNIQFYQETFILFGFCRNRMWGHGILYKKEGGVKFSGIMRNDKMHRNEETGH